MTGTVEKVYSQALFELASENDSAALVNEELSALAEIFRNAPEFSKFLLAPTVSSTEKARFTETVLKDRISALTYNFLCLLTDKRRVRYLPAIAKSFEELFYEANNIVNVKVTTSIPLSETLRTKLKNKLESVYGKTVILEENTDPGILGGVIINYGNTMLDGSVKAKLDLMQKQIKGFTA